MDFLQENWKKVRREHPYWHQDDISRFVFAEYVRQNTPLKGGLKIRVDDQSSQSHTEQNGNNK
jgi:hypothetical protein